jgi:hypothetical protein
VQVYATDPNGDQLTFSLGAGAPPGASIQTNGLFSWAPTRAYAQTTNPIAVIASENAVPSLSATQTLVVTVLDYLELDLGATNVNTGQTATLPISLASNDGVTDLVFTVQVPTNVFTNWALVQTAPQVASAAVQDLTTNIVVSLSTLPGQTFQGTQQVAQLSFLAETNDHSGIFGLPVVHLTGLKPTSGAYSNYIVQPGSVVVVADQPLLRSGITNQQPVLALFGKPGVEYQVQFSTDIMLPSAWEPLLDYTQTTSTACCNNKRRLR